MRSPRLLVLSLTLLIVFGFHPQAQSGKQSTTSSTNEAEIKALYDRWAKAFEARDIDAIMAVYAPGDALIAYDVIPPL